MLRVLWFLILFGFGVLGVLSAFSLLVLATGVLLSPIVYLAKLFKGDEN